MTIPDVGTTVLPIVLVVSGVATGLVVALAVAAFRRRRSRSYLLVTLALAALLVRTFFGALSHGGVLGPETHHVLEHGLDALAVLLLLGAVYFARTVGPSTEVARE